MGKNILIFSDGTAQAGGLRPDQRLSNIYKLYRATRIGPDSPIDPSRQVTFYDPGLGTEEDEGRIPFRSLRVVRKFASAANGLGIGRNIVDCYEAILKHYEAGDRIYLFGFSRGAYTARCVAEVLDLCGVPTKGSKGWPRPRYGSEVRAIAEEAVKKVYEHGAGLDRARFEVERNEKALRFRDTYGCGDKSMTVVPYFIGVFDTVAALGASGMQRVVMNACLLIPIVAVSAVPSALWWWYGSPLHRALLALVALSAVICVTAWVLVALSRIRVIWNYPKPGRFRLHLSGWRAKFYDRRLSRRVQYARHALAIDETRAAFKRVAWGFKGAQPDRPGEQDWFRQVWFAGSHSDIGGSYPEEESRLSDIALQWMVEQATEIPDPILVDWEKLHLFPSADGMQHCEAESALDKWPNWIPRRWRRGWRLAPRIEALGAPLHSSVT